MSKKKCTPLWHEVHLELKSAVESCLAASIQHNLHLEQPTLASICRLASILFFFMALPTGCSHLCKQICAWQAAGSPVVRNCPYGKSVETYFKLKLISSLRLLSQQRGYSRCSVPISWRSPLPGIYSSIFKTVSSFLQGTQRYALNPIRFQLLTALLVGSGPEKFG